MTKSPKGKGPGTGREGGRGHVGKGRDLAQEGKGTGEPGAPARTRKGRHADLRGRQGKGNQVKERGPEPGTDTETGTHEARGARIRSRSTGMYVLRAYLAGRCQGCFGARGAGTASCLISIDRHPYAMMLCYIVQILPARNVTGEDGLGLLGGNFSLLLQVPEGVQRKLLAARICRSSSRRECRSGLRALVPQCG